MKLQGEHNWIMGYCMLDGAIAFEELDALVRESRENDEGYLELSVERAERGTWVVHFLYEVSSFEDAEHAPEAFFEDAQRALMKGLAKSPLGWGHDGAHRVGPGAQARAAWRRAATNPRAVLVWRAERAARPVARR